MADISKILHRLLKSQITYVIIFFAGWTAGIISSNWLFLLPFYLLTFLLILYIPLDFLFFRHKKEGNSPFVFLRKVYFPFLLILPYAYGIGKAYSYLFEITGKEVSKEINEHFFTIDPRDLREAENLVRHKHVFFSFQLSQMYYSNDIGTALSRPYCLLDAFPWLGDYFWDGNKWVGYDAFINNRSFRNANNKE